MLEVSKVLDHDPFLLASDGPVASLCHQVQHALAIFILTSMITCQMFFEIIVADETCIAELTDKRWAQDGLIIENAQGMTTNVIA